MPVSVSKSNCPETASPSRSLLPSPSAYPKLILLVSPLVEIPNVAPIGSEALPITVNLPTGFIFIPIPTAWAAHPKGPAAKNILLILMPLDFAVQVHSVNGLSICPVILTYASKGLILKPKS